MRPRFLLWRAAALAFVLAVGAAACTRERAGSDDAAPPSPSSGAAASAPASAPPPAPAASSAPSSNHLVLGGPAPPTSAATPPPGVPFEGNACSPGKDSIACTAGGGEVLTCAGGQWRMLESCSGPGRCVGKGSALTCDTGIPQPGDACVPGKAEPQCHTAHEALLCQGGKWMVSPCAAGHLCLAAAGKAPAGCK
jgi:hypothetical protein